MKAEPMSVVTRPGCTATNVKPSAAVMSDAQLSVTASMNHFSILCRQPVLTLEGQDFYQELLLLHASEHSE